MEGYLPPKKVLLQVSERLLRATSVGWNIDLLGWKGTFHPRRSSRGCCPHSGGQKYRFFKNLGNGFAWCGNIPTSLETIFKLSRGPQRPYIKKSKFSNIN